MAEVVCPPNITILPYQDWTDGFRAYSVAYSILVTLYILASLGWWYHRRDHPYLARRRFNLVLTVALGVKVELLASSWRRGIVGYPCTLGALAFEMCLFVTAWPVTVRLLQFYMRVNYNKMLAFQLMSEDGSTRALLGTSEYEWKRLFASRKFAIFLTAVPLLTFTFVGIYPAIAFCNTIGPCTSGSEITAEGQINLAYLLIMMLLLLGANVVVLYKTRNEPDPIFIRRETVQAWVASLTFGIPGFFLFLTDTGGFETKAQANWSWTVMLDWTFLVFFTVSAVIPVMMTYTPMSEYKDVSFDAFLESIAGLRNFALYLATENSLENLLFYRAVKRWKRDFHEEEPERIRERANEIRKTYMSRFEVQAVTLSASAHRDIVTTLSSGDELPISLFDNGLSEVVRTMYSDSYSRFRRSQYYELYLNNVDPEQEDEVVQRLENDN